MSTARHLLACFLAGLIIQSCSAEECAPHWTHYEGNCYRLFGDPVNWDTASRNCRQMGSELAAVHSAGENVFLYSHWKTASRSPQPSHFGYWLGLNDIANEGTFVNSDGSPADFLQWISNEPNGGSQENCVHLHYRGTISDTNMDWNDFPCTNSMSYFCKRRPSCD